MSTRMVRVVRRILSHAINRIEEERRERFVARGAGPFSAPPTHFARCGVFTFVKKKKSVTDNKERWRDVIAGRSRSLRDTSRPGMKSERGKERQIERERAEGVLADGNSPGSGIHGFVNFPGNPRGPTRGLGFINPYEIRTRFCHPRQEYIRPEIHKFMRRPGFMSRENALYQFLLRFQAL